MIAITYTLELEQPLLAVGPEGDPNTASSMPYVPGSLIRGALAARYLEQKGPQVGQEFTRFFLNGAVRYLNAYPEFVEPANGGHRSLPAPAPWAREKDVDPHSELERVYPQTEEVVDDDGNHLPRLPQSLGKAFVHAYVATANGNSYVEVNGPTVAYEIAIHTARNRQYGRAIEGDDSSAVFRYRALARGQRYVGVIVVSNPNDASTIYGLLASNAPMFLGGSHTAGYGRVTVHPNPLDEVLANTGWRELAGELKAIPADEPFLVYLTSDAVLRDPKTGQPTVDICPFLPAETSGKKVIYSVKQAFVKPIWVGGFNRTWELPLPQEWAVEKGSAWLVSADQSLSATDLQAIEQKGIGARTAEGFGSVVFRPAWPKGTLYLRRRGGEEAAVSTARFPALRGDAARLLSEMRQRLARHELDRFLVIAAQKKTERPPRGRLSKSQLGRLRLRLRGEVGDDFAGFRDYLAGTGQRKSAEDQFRGFYVDGRNFRDWLVDMATHPTQVWDQILPNAEWEPRPIGAEPYQFRTDAQMTREYALRYMLTVCELLAKPARGEVER